MKMTMVSSLAFSPFRRRLVTMFLAGTLAAMLAAVAFVPTTAVATHNSTHMRTPFVINQTWIVTNGYGQGDCHHRPSPCGGDELYALDLVPYNDATKQRENAGGKVVYSPVRGTVSAKYDIRGKKAGEGIRITTKDGDIVELDHLMNLRVSVGRKVTAQTRVGQVFNQYGGPEGPNNHLHIQLSNSQRVSQPIKLAGKTYHSGTTWKGQLIRENAVFAKPKYRPPRWWFVQDFRNLGKVAVGNDAVSSLRVNPGCQVTIYNNRNYTGGWAGFTQNVPNLATFAPEFDNKASSIRLRCNAAAAPGP
jgi:hypothetical protein